MNDYNNTLNSRVAVWHMSGEKYFSHLNNIANVDFFCLHWLRFWLGRGKFRSTKSVSKLKKLHDINIVCLVPFDPNIFIFYFKKVFLQRRAKLFLHTSWPDHNSGKILNRGLMKNIWCSIVNKAFDGIITPIPSIVNDLQRNYKIPVRAIPHPVSEQIALTNHTKQTWGELKIGFLGEKTRKKGIDRIFLLAEKNPSLKFEIAGPGALQQICPPNVVVQEKLGRSEVAEFLSSIDILLVPSRAVQGWEELFGIVIIEALALNKVVFATNHVGPRYIKTRIPQLNLVEDSDLDWANISIQKFSENHPSTADITLESFGEAAILKRWCDVFSGI